MRDVRLSQYQLEVAADAVGARERELERRLKRSSYDGKPGMKSSVLAELAELKELRRVFRHNLEQLRRQERYERLREGHALLVAEHRGEL